MADANDLLIASYERELRSRNRSARTIQSYRETLEQLAAHHDGASIEKMTKADIQSYIEWAIGEHSPGTAAVRYRSLHAFFNWAADEEILDRSPMAKMRPPSVRQEPVAVLEDDQLKALLKVCGGKEFEDRRDTAIIRLFCEPGSPRVSEMAGIAVDDVDLRRDLIRLLGKGDRVRHIPFGAKTGQAIDRYVRVRVHHPLARAKQMWLGGRGKALTASGIYQMVERRAAQAGIGHVHPHQLRHTSAHVWKDRGGSEGDMMVLFGWTSPEMPRHYGRSAEVDRAQRSSRRISPADRL